LTAGGEFAGWVEVLLPTRPQRRVRMGTRRWMSDLA